MHNQQQGKYSNRIQGGFKKSLLAAAIITSCQPLMAAENDKEKSAEDDIEVIEIKGIRKSLHDAKELKMASDTFVDAISADDIGALPDRSVLESMQRIPGVSIERFAAADDPDHFGVEGSGAVIRGMTATRSEFNGRDSFSANSGRGLSFQDVPPELMGSVRVYKNQSADMIEGGIGGTVSLHTKLPFDSDERTIAFSADTTYNDLSETTVPSVSGLFSDVYYTDLGKFGVLASIANNRVTSRSDSLQSEVFLHRDDLALDADGNPMTVLAPNGGNVGQKYDERERLGISLAAQWQSADQRTLITGQFLRSDADLAWTENSLSYQTNMWADDGSIRRESFPLDGYPSYEYDQSGTFEQGYITHTPAGGWRSNGADQERFPVAADWSGNPVPQFGHLHQATSRLKQQNTLVEDFAVNIKHRPNDSWAHEFDVQFIRAETTDDDVTLYLGFHANQHLDFTGDIPKISYLEPWNGHPGGNGQESNPEFFQTPASYYWRSAMDHYERSDGDSAAVKYDVKYTLDDGIITHVKAGVRYAEREQTVRFSTWNWQFISDFHTNDIDGDGFAAAWLDLPMAASLADETQMVSWDDHHRGGAVAIAGGQTIHPSMDLVRDYQNWDQRFAGITADWESLGQRQIIQSYDANGDPVYEQLSGPFRPAEINSFVETNTAAYLRFDYFTELGDFSIEGNFGVRYVSVERKTAGAVTFPDLVAPDANDEKDFRNVLPQAQQDFANYAYQKITDVATEDHVLPSFNAKVELTDDLLFRFAVSKAIAFPDTGDMKNYVSLSAGATTVEREQATDPDVDPDNLKVISANVDEWVGNSGNPYLKAMEAWNWDAALEWYPEDGGSFTFSLFHKDIENFFMTGTEVVNYSNNGQSYDVLVQRPINNGEATMDGYEIAFNKFIGSFGMEATYSYIDAKGVPNANLFRTSTDGSPSSGGEAALEFEDLPLQGQSKHTANLALMFQNDDVSARLAYNWRSRYLITVRDVIAPYRPIYGEDAGYMDGSVFYNFSEDMQIGIQGVNLLDTVTKTSMQVDSEGTTAGRSWFINDRRVSLVLRGKF